MELATDVCRVYVKEYKHGVCACVCVRVCMHVHMRACVYVLCTHVCVRVCVRGMACMFIEKGIASRSHPFLSNMHASIWHFSRRESGYARLRKGLLCV